MDVFTLLIIHKTKRDLFLRQVEGIGKMILNQCHPPDPVPQSKAYLGNNPFIWVKKEGWRVYYGEWWEGRGEDLWFGDPSRMKRDTSFLR